MSFIQRLTKSLRSARTVQLPDDAKSAFYMLMPMVIGNQHKSVQELLSSSKYDVNYKCGRAQRTLLHISANCGSYECLCLLIKKGSDVNARDASGCTPLHLAARNGQKKCLIHLLEHKATVDIRNNEGLTMLHWLAVNGRAELLQDLFQYVQEVDIEDSQGQTALHVACQNGHKTTVQCLVDHGADINRPNHFGWTPLHFACSNGQLDTASFLLKKGARIPMQSRPAGHSPSTRMSNRQGGSGEAEAKTPLELCVEGGYSETCDVLIQQWPALFPHLIDIAGSDHISETKVLKVLKYLCVQHGLSMGVNVFTHLSEQASNVGHSVLSVSTNAESQVTCLLRYVRILTQLFAVLIKHYENNNLVNPDLAEQHFLSTLQPLELLWQLMEEWLLIVREELQYSQLAKGIVTSTPPDTQTLPESGGDRTSGQNTASRASGGSECRSEDAQSPVRQCSGRSPVRADILRQRKQLSQDSHNDNVLEVIVPRLCGVIHAYYLVCSCEKQTQDSTSSRFVQFLGDHKDVLMALIERDPTVIFDHFHFLLDLPDLLAVFLPLIRKQPFEVRRQWFYERLRQDLVRESLGGADNSGENTPEEVNTLLVHRDDIFHSSCSQILKKSPDTLKRWFNLRFEGEEGMGQGVVREWFDVLSKEILNPDYALFTQSADGSTFQPNSNSSVNPDHLNYFRFAGQCLGLALYHQQLINAYFTRSFYKHILGVPVNYTDVVSIDPEYAKNLQWILDHDIGELGLDLTFSVETDVFGVLEEVELKKGGSRIPVTDQNKAEYVQLVTELRMTRAIQPQIDSFLSGFNQYIPQNLVRLFDEYELELLLSGIPEINIQDWKDNTTYVDCSAESDVVKWFWEVLEEFTEQERVLMLQFVTGSSRLPFGGFSKLTGGGGPQKFTISVVPYTQDLLPTASTCINFLRLPDYPSKDLTRDKIQVALQCGSQGYALA